MTKNDVVNKIKGFKQTIPQLGGKVSDTLIKKCVDMANEMTFVPCVRPIVDDEIYGTGIAFDYDEEGGGLSVEITVTDNGVYGYINYNEDEIGCFDFDTETDAVNFWNVIVGKVAKG